MKTMVVAGIIQRDGCILLAQRSAGSHHGLLWEFPGGKVEPGETPEDALVRELREELDFTVQVGAYFTAQDLSTPAGDYRILYYFSVPIGGEPQPVQCHALQWVSPDEAVGYDLSPADAKVAQLYLEKTSN